ncbi:hypothetical protein MHH70_17320 [Metasolibacillus sp. FSL H7-0170]|uniref:hypothetical protein n=1 Tax=Metasolibacillus sp. FSL H7-0170 TaxID=2921431 RepID=UPI0031597676
MSTILRPFIDKILTAFFSTILTSFALASIMYRPKELMAQQQTYYASFIELFVWYSIYVFVIYMTVGIGISFLIEQRTSNTWYSLFLHGILGGLIITIFSLLSGIQTDLAELLGIFVIGVSAGGIFYSVQAILLRRRKK